MQKIEFDEGLFNYLKLFLTEERLALFYKMTETRTAHLTMVLEDIYQTQNASALIRTADALGLAEVHAVEATNLYKPNKEIAKGAYKWMPVNRYRDADNSAVHCINSLKNKGYKVAVTSPHKEGYTPFNLPINEPLAICFGTELEGATQTLKSAADYFVQIPMYGFTESFNVSVSAGIVMTILNERVRNSQVNYTLNKHQKDELVLHWIRNHSKQMAKLENLYYAEKAG
ncbi:MAG: TrmH family RNA methyltransferase [Luteibaculaceae bacterium]